MSLKLIIDENLPPRWVPFLENHGVLASHWRDLGTVGDQDDIIFQFARKEQWIILSQDLDFSRLLALYGTKLPSVLQLRVDVPIPEVIGAQVIQVLHDHATAITDGSLISIDLQQARVRLLPLR